MPGHVPGIRFFVAQRERFEEISVRTSPTFAQPMRTLILAAILGLASLLQADDAKPTQYTAVVSGIVCQTCKTTVIDSLKKLPGVKEVDFSKGDKEGTHKLTFTAKGDALTKNDAELALGEHVKEFTVVSFEKGKYAQSFR
jgi:copper chaperone CopZ